MKIAIHIDNRNISKVDCSDLLKGNPGIGGTEYCFLILAQAMKKHYPQHEIVLFAEKKGKLPYVDDVVLTDGIEDLINKVSQDNFDVLLLNSLRDGKPLKDEWFGLMNEKNIKVVLWAHNFYYSDYCTRIAACDAVKANVFVGKQQYDRYIDHQIANKSTYIFNMYPVGEKVRNQEFDKAVTYIGSLVPGKGFHILAEQWKEILEKVPDAQLNVIGSGKLYNRDSKLGKFGIAEERYENAFMKHLVDENGKMLPSVHFLGIMGAEKSEVIANTAVGVVNPTGRTETFGISAIDFESMCVPVVTIATGGFLDTVIDKKTGRLYKKKSKLADCVSELLLDKERNIQYGKAGRELSKSFAPEVITPVWMELFERIASGQPSVSYHKPDDFLTNNLKHFRIANRAIKKTLHIKKGLSVIGAETFARNILRRLGR